MSIEKTKHNPAFSANLIIKGGHSINKPKGKGTDAFRYLGISKYEPMITTQEIESLTSIVKKIKPKNATYIVDIGNSVTRSEKYSDGLSDVSRYPMSVGSVVNKKIDLINLDQGFNPKDFQQYKPFIILKDFFNKLIKN